MNSKIMQGSFFDVLATNDLVFDLVVTSPPYYNARDYGGEEIFSDGNAWFKWCTKSILFLIEHVKDSGVIWWNTGDAYENHRKITSNYKMVAFLESRGVYLIDEIPWIKKTNPPKNAKNRPYTAWEHNFIFSKFPEKVTFNKDAMRRPYNPVTLERMKYKVNKLHADKKGEYGNPQFRKVEPHPGGAVHPNYLFLPQDYTKRPHPAPMSPELANWAIRAYSPEGGLVLDPMAGIGTTWIECEKLGRQFFGCELYQKYIDIACISYERLLRGDDPYNGLKKEVEQIGDKNV